MQRKHARTSLYLATRTVSQLMAGAVLATSMPLLAQGQQVQGRLEEIVVTAQHREQNLQDIPVTVSALSASDLQEAQVFGAADVAFKIPGMSYAEFAPGQALVAIRGISSGDDGAGMDNSVAMFLDGVYIGKGAAINFEMFDLERIEVLRGPQGTLFGRNAVGGVINVITSKPTEELTAKAEVSAGNEGFLRYAGLVSGPITENLLGKISFAHREHDGYVDNIVLGKEQQDEDNDSVRGQLLFKTDMSEWLLSGDYMEDDREDMGRFPHTPGAPLDSVQAWEDGGGDFGKVLAPQDGGSDRESGGVSLTANIEFESGTLTSISAYRSAETDWQMASIGVAWNGGAEVIDNIQEDIDTYSQELRWSSNLNGPINYVAGLYYMQEDTDRNEAFELHMPGGVPGGTGPHSLFGNEISNQSNESTSYAAYMQGDYEINDQWTATVGARYTYDEKETESTSVNCGMLPPGFEDWPGCETGRGSLSVIPNTFNTTGDEDWDNFSPRFSMAYRPHDELMFFGTVAKGFKSGGFAGAPGTVESATTPLDEETVWSYELGMKGDFLDRNLRLNATVFYMDYEDLQIVRFGDTPESPNFGQFVSKNIGTADIYGLEMEWLWHLTDNLTFSGYYAYLDTEIDGLVIETSTDTTDLSGLDLRQAPENTASATLAYHLPLDSGAGVNMRLDYSYADENFHDYATSDVTITEEVTLWDARVAWVSSDQAWEVAAWGKNLSDEEWISHSYRIGPGSIGIWGAPRTYGLSVIWSM